MGQLNGACRSPLIFQKALNYFVQGQQELQAFGQTHTGSPATPALKYLEPRHGEDLPRLPTQLLALL